MKLIDSLCSFIAPYFCGHCRSYLAKRAPLCASCKSQIQPVLSSRFVLSRTFTLQVHALSAYDYPLKSLVLASQRNEYEASIHLGDLLWEYGIVPPEVDYLIPVPLHFRKQAARGYNQARVMAKHISLLSGIPTLDCIIRIKNTGPQSRYTRVERFQNVENAFQLTPEAAQVKGKNVVLVDDVMASGATLIEIAKLLIKADPAQLKAVVACGEHVE